MIERIATRQTMNLWAAQQVADASASTHAVPSKLARLLVPARPFRPLP